VISLVAKALGMTPSSIRQRIKSGMPVGIAITLPKVPNGFARKTFRLTHAH